MAILKETTFKVNLHNWTAEYSTLTERIEIKQGSDKTFLTLEDLDLLWELRNAIVSNPQSKPRTD